MPSRSKRGPKKTGRPFVSLDELAERLRELRRLRQQVHELEKGIRVEGRTNKASK